MAKGINEQKMVNLSDYRANGIESIKSEILEISTKEDREEMTYILLGVSHFSLIMLNSGFVASNRILENIVDYLASWDTLQFHHIGAGKFFIMIPNKADVADFIEGVQTRFKSYWGIGNLHYIGFNMSVFSSKENISLEEVFNHLEYALKQAKKKGRNHITYWGEDLDKRYKRYKVIYSYIELAFKEKSFEVYYQPIFNLKTESFDRLEALTRLKDFGGNFISPIEFIPIIEESGRIIELGEFVITEVCKFIKANNIKQRVYINLSASHFIGDNLIHFLKETLNKYNVSPYCIGLELLETEQIISQASILKTIGDLQKLGIRCAFDDFGTGYSSLWYLNALPMSDLKISRELVTNILMSEKEANLVKMIMSVAKDYNMSVTAEGVEDIQLVDALKIMGCNHIQGFLYSKPIPGNEIIKKYCV